MIKIYVNFSSSDDHETYPNLKRVKSQCFFCYMLSFLKCKRSVVSCFFNAWELHILFFCLRCQLIDLIEKCQTLKSSQHVLICFNIENLCLAIG